MKRLLVVLLLFSSASINAQYIEEYPSNPGNGDLMIEIKNWQVGVRIFTDLIKKSPNNNEYRFKLGKCYTYSDINQAKGLAYLKDLIELEVKADDFEETLALAYYRNYEFEEAKKLYMSLAEKVDDSDKAEEYRDMISQCDVAEKMFKNPVNVSFENLGKDVNSEGPDFLPIVTPDEAHIYFTTRRKGVVGNLYSYAGYYTADIFYAKHKRNRYSRARSVGAPNTYGNEFTAGRSEDGQYLIYTVNSEDYFNDIFVSEMGRRSYMPPKVLDNEEVNKKTSELGATLTNDGNRLYFSSDRPGGEGGHDIWYVQRLPIAGWSEPVNVGKSINTSGDEMYPMLVDGGTALCFSSNGHKGMGGMDVYKSKGGSKTWATPQNLGYPINTPSDDWNISFAENTKYAYMAKNLDDSYGDLDIYRLTFGDAKDKYTVLSGKVTTTDSIPILKTIEILIFEESSGLLVGTYISNNKSGKYFAALPPGRFMIEVKDAEGYAEYEKEVVILGKNDQRDFKKFDIQLIPK